MADLRDWPGERFAHRSMLDRVWQLRDTVLGWDAFFVTLAEALDAMTLVIVGANLPRTHGRLCQIEVLGGSAG